MRYSAYMNTSVIFTMGKVQPDEIEHFLNLGAVHVIAQPFDPMTLGKTIQKVLNKVDD
jgi:CheY-like chemotaxis protein|tara:strand:- start:347 stop:520 length:174 start_codon:yes stop_codon:yes gene_type:complete